MISSSSSSSSSSSGTSSSSSSSSSSISICMCISISLITRSEQLNFRNGVLAKTARRKAGNGKEQARSARMVNSETAKQKTAETEGTTILRRSPAPATAGRCRRASLAYLSAAGCWRSRRPPPRPPRWDY